jgi:maltooligosyltrehalose trehalohydrolase
MQFRVWAPRTSSLQLKVIDGPVVGLRRSDDGYFTGEVPVEPGARYFYRFPDGRERPDPRSLFQPLGVHGPSEVVDLAAIAPRTAPARVPLEKLVFCEIHLGTFTPEGTADAAVQFMPELAAALYTAVEIMPVAAFAGDRGWGYDGVNLHAVHAAYGGPAALARLIDAAHRAGLSVFLDLVYNHLGPEGNYLADFGPYFTSKHKTPWGDALDFSLPPVREYFVENALRWASWVDGLRLDAVHGILDDSPKHILQEIAVAVRAQGKLVIAESELNDPRLIDEYGLDASWADDLHHAIHVALTGEHQGYYADYQDPLAKMAHAIERGWCYEGAFKPSFNRPHGRPAAHLPGRRFVVCAQNHDQIGNRTKGERLISLAGPDGEQVAMAVIALQPSLPLFFQGEEWGAREPFQYFTSHTDPELAEAVRKGRREEFRDFAWQGKVPDPQAVGTFQRSKIDRSRKDPSMLAWHLALLELRSRFRDDSRSSVRTEVQGKVLLLQRGEILLVASFGEGPFAVRLPEGGFRVLLDSGKSEQSMGILRGRSKQAIVLERR